MSITIDDLRALKEKQKPAIHIAKRYQCPTCDTLHADRYDAEDCCPREVETGFVCLICENDDAFMAELFGSEKEVAEHAEKEHRICSVEADYFTELLEGRASCQWAFEMAQTTEFLIPADHPADLMKV